MQIKRREEERMLSDILITQMIFTLLATMHLCDIVVIDVT